MEVVIIGAGLGGLSAACLLASEGHAVTVLEKNNHLGGKINEVTAQGFRFDTGPSLLTMPSVVESLFERCGTKLASHLTLRELNPICHYFYRNGVAFNCHKDTCVNIAQIQQFAPKDVQAYKKFMDYAEKLYQRTKEAFLFNPLYQFDDLRALNWKDLLHIDALKTVADRIDQTFESPELRQFFKRFTTYNGSSPYQAPATLNVIPHVELSLGSYYIKGGMYRLVEALARLARLHGATIKTGTDIRHIQTKQNRVTGVTDQAGTSYPADVVVSNADAHETYRYLLPDHELSLLRRKKLDQTEPSCSGFVLLLGIDTTYDQLEHHNIFFSGDYRQEFCQIFDQKVMPDDPTIYVANTSHSDPGHAPAGGSNLFVLVNAPYLSSSYPWEKQQAACKNRIIHALEQRGLKNLSSHIRYSDVITPRDFYRLYRSKRGSIYGTSSNSKWAAFLRPRNKSRAVDGLYLVGGSTHPGGGIPLVILSAFHALSLINRFE